MSLDERGSKKALVFGSKRTTKLTKASPQITERGIKKKESKQSNVNPSKKISFKRWIRRLKTKAKKERKKQKDKKKKKKHKRKEKRK